MIINFKIVICVTKVQNKLWDHILKALRELYMHR